MKNYFILMCLAMSMIIIRQVIPSVIALFIVVAFNSCTKIQEKKEPQIKLVLQITVDGLRADLIERSKTSFIDGGFNHLLKNGTYYTNAHYQHANTETIVGHTTLATGTTPSNHGMVGNVWFDDQTGEIGYNIEDPQAPILPTRTSSTEGSQIDPAQRASRTKGRSPKAILSSTISDEIFASTGGQSKIFGVSGKDRSAVAMAGHQGKAFWYSTDSGDFISSKYYYDKYPSWVQQWNSKRMAENISGKKWELINDPSSYQFIDQDDRAYEVDLKGYGRTFPHPFGEAQHPLFFTRVLVSPYGDALTLDFAQNLIENEQLGQDDILDYLSISFSGVDAINHFFGPSSLENEDVVLQLDRTLKSLFEFIDEKIGLDNTLIILSADHGMSEMPEYMNEQGLQVGRIYSDEIVNKVNEIGKNELNIDGVAKSFFRPSLYLNEAKIKESGIELKDAAKIIAKNLTDMEGIHIALSKGDMNNKSSSEVFKKIKNNFHPERSGNIYVAQEPYWFLFEKGPIGVMHGSPWEYDTHVPIIFSGPGINTTHIDRLVHPADIAPTLATYLNIKSPSKSTGNILTEISK